MNTQYNIVTKEAPTFYFIGVTTGSSSIMKVFPLWMEELGRSEIMIEGIDLKIHDDPEAYRQAVAQIKRDPLSLGALVTTHKIDLYEAAQDLFDYLDPYAQLTGELSSISKRNGRLEGHAKDPITARLSMDHIVGEDYFGRTGGHVLCFGAGGSAKATLLQLINKENAADRPEKFIVVDLLQSRLDRMKALVNSLNCDMELATYCHQEPKRNDMLMADLPEGSVVINATGMGKDIPGSPITDDGLFPRNGIAWEFNYRGERDFMHQALRQRKERNVLVQDGWVYFIHGWTQVIAQVLHTEITAELFRRLSEIATAIRPLSNNIRPSGLSRSCS